MTKETVKNQGTVISKDNGSFIVHIVNPNKTSFDLKVYSNVDVKVGDLVMLEGTVTWDKTAKNGIAVKSKKVVAVND